MSSNYWSSTTNANNTNNAWHVRFYYGNDSDDYKSTSYYVRAVRSGKCSLLSFESVYRAYLDCRKRKRGTINELRFEYDETLSAQYSLVLLEEGGMGRYVRERYVSNIYRISV